MKHILCHLLEAGQCHHGVGTQRIRTPEAHSVQTPIPTLPPFPGLVQHVAWFGFTEPCCPSYWHHPPFMNFIGQAGSPRYGFSIFLLCMNVSKCSQKIVNRLAVFTWPSSGLFFLQFIHFAMGILGMWEEGNPHTPANTHTQTHTHRHTHTDPHTHRPTTHRACCLGKTLEWAKLPERWLHCVVRIMLFNTAMFLCVCNVRLVSSHFVYFMSCK